MPEIKDLRIGQEVLIMIEDERSSSVTEHAGKIAGLWSKGNKAYVEVNYMGHLITGYADIETIKIK